MARRLPPNRKFFCEVAIDCKKLIEQTRATMEKVENNLRKQQSELENDLTAARALVASERNLRHQTEAAEREHRELAEALRDTIAALNSTLNLDEVLDRILTNVGRVVPHDGASIMLVEAECARIVRFRNHFRPETELVTLNHSFLIDKTPTLQQMALTGRPLSIPDITNLSDWVPIPYVDWQRSYLGTPIQREDRIIGFLNLDSATPDFFSQTHVERLHIFADHAAIAIRNAQHYAEVQELATLRERERLAHELHDAVSQTLWSSTLIADVLPSLWEQNPEKGREHLLELNQLIREALTEMRTLLLQLRPSTLVETSLEDMLAQLVTSTANRTGIDAHFVHEGKVCQLSPDTKLALYRMAQEAINNIARHSMATQLCVELICQPDQISLIIGDNGCGFNLKSIPKGHLGLSIMRQRADAIGASLRISSQIGQGTQIHISWVS